MKKSPQAIIRSLERLDWDLVQNVGTAFTDSLEEIDGHINPSAEDLASLIMLTAKLLEFVGQAKEILHDEYDCVSSVS